MPVAATSLSAKPAGPADEGVAQMAAGKSHDINRPGLYDLVQAFDQDQMEAALQGLQSMSGLTDEDLPRWAPVLFFATMPESYDDGFKSLQKYVAKGVSIQHLSVWQLVAGRRTAC